MEAIRQHASPAELHQAMLRAAQTAAKCIP